MRTVLCVIVGLSLMSLSAFGYWVRPILPSPVLSSLADHEGLTWTHLLLPGSGAIDTAIVNEGSPLVDQRGFPRACGAGPDIGAIEIEPTD